MIYLEESFLNLQKDIQGYKGKLSFDYSGTLSNLRLKVKNLLVKCSSRTS